ncbi:MAG: hypothetical protein IJS28_09470 [Synergistaceae bacterium]|nr:hypothetical protein [Synergistaceae bacterium]
MLALKIENLGKRYMLHHQMNRRLYDALGSLMQRLGRRIRHPFAERSCIQETEEFMALCGLYCVMCAAASGRRNAHLLREE